MRIGYVAQNLSLGCTPASTFRLASYSPEHLRLTVASNLACLRRILEFNLRHGLLYYRISSDTVPFASHPVCDFDWAGAFADELASLGSYIKANGMRVAMHPGQYTLVNSPDEKTWLNSVAELAYQAKLLDLMGLDTTAKLQIHVGGVYSDKPASLRRFIKRFALLPESVRRRLAVENDERLYGVRDCLQIAAATGVPVIFDDFHFRLMGEALDYHEALRLIGGTWRAADGAPLVDYSSQDESKRFGSHGATLDEAHFAEFLDRITGHAVDVMLEIKDKDRSAVRARAILVERGL